MPPTPTPFPAPGSMPLNPSTFSLWNYTDWAVHGWQFIGVWGTVAQVLLILIAVGFGIVIVQGFFRKLSMNQAEIDAE